MQKLPAPIQSLVRNEDGATAIEYGLIAAAIAVAILTAMVSIGGHMDGMFHAVAVLTAFH